MVSCHCICGWTLPCFSKVACIYVHNLLIICGFIAKIDNNTIIILIGKDIFNKFIGDLFPLMHVWRSRFNMFYKFICMLFWISMYVLTRSHKYFDKSLDSVVGSYLGEDADLVFFSTLSKTIQRHNPSTFHRKGPRLIFKASSKNALIFLFLLQIFLKLVQLLVCSFKIVYIYQFQILFYIYLSSLKLIN